MAETFVQLPDDSANTGKKIRANSRVVGANTVLEHLYSLTDYGSDTQAKIKAAATAAVAGDPSLVVALSPNSPLPAGANAIGSVTTDAIKLADVTVKAASTASVAGDKSLVTALSPNSPLPAGSNAIGTVILGAADNVVGRVKITDGTNVAAVKAASTAAVATDPAQVVSISPNTALPAGANIIGGVNLASVNGTTISAKTLPTGGTGLAAIPVWNNAIQLLTYHASARNIATGALVANTAKAVLSIEHALASTKKVKIRRIIVSGRQVTTLAGNLDIQLTRGTAASSAGTAVTPTPAIATDAAAEAVVKSLPTIVAATVVGNYPFAAMGTAAASAQPATVIYDWQENGETKALELTAGALQSLVLNAISDVAQNWTLTMLIIFTEE